MSDQVKTELISALNTFLATFLATAGMMLSEGGITWTVAFWVSVGIAALRSGVKAVINSFVPIRLGGRAQ